MHKGGRAMHARKTNVLVVEDNQSVRLTLSHTLAKFGYRVRSAEDGFSALVELRDEVPDVILSDLNMPGMSGFEFLSVVRRRFPAIRTIAMSGAYSGKEVPPGVSADAFHEKGTDVMALLEIVAAISLPDSSPVPHRRKAVTPVWVPCSGPDSTGKFFAIVNCAECLRTFSQSLGKVSAHVEETHCIHCDGPIHYAILPANDSDLIHTYRAGSGAAIVLDLPKVN
jgi:CheY-like chemotaxis protein